MKIFNENSPKRFWQIADEISDSVWSEATTKALVKSGFSIGEPDRTGILPFILSESQFGPEHWNLGLSKKVYYMLKPLLPRVFTRLLRNVYSSKKVNNHPQTDCVESVL